jgi:hypothetical protein
MVYREKSEERLAIETFIKDFKYQTGGEIETMSPDSPAGQAFIETYDVVSYPTLLALTPEGTPAAVWRGALPTISDASGYK